jgi:hypothetical protein
MRYVFIGLLSAMLWRDAFRVRPLDGRAGPPLILKRGDTALVGTWLHGLPPGYGLKAVQARGVTVLRIERIRPADCLARSR